MALLFDALVFSITTRQLACLMHFVLQSDTRVWYTDASDRTLSALLTYSAGSTTRIESWPRKKDIVTRDVKDSIRNFGYVLETVIIIIPVTGLDIKLLWIIRKFWINSITDF